MKKQTAFKNMVPILLGFAAMGTVDFSAYVKGIAQSEFNLSDGVAAFIPACCYVWFFLCSWPSCRLMSRIGKKRFAVASLIMVSAAMFLICLFPKSIWIFFLSLCLQGIGNTFLITAMNPLVRDIVGDTYTAGAISIASAAKSLAGVSMPLLIGGLAATQIGWQASMAVTGVVGIVAAIWLLTIKIDESGEDHISMSGMVRLLFDRKMAKCFIAGALLVCFDICFISRLPYLIQGRLDLDVAEATSLSFVYPAAKMIFAFLGGILLLKISVKHYLAIALPVLTIGLFLITVKQIPVLLPVAIVGASYSNLFTIVYSYAMKSYPVRTSEVSALMVMSLCGGALALLCH